MNILIPYDKSINRKVVKILKVAETNPIKENNKLVLLSNTHPKTVKIINPYRSVSQNSIASLTPISIGLIKTENDSSSNSIKDIQSHNSKETEKNSNSSEEVKVLIYFIIS